MRLDLNNEVKFDWGNENGRKEVSYGVVCAIMSFGWKIDKD